MAVTAATSLEPAPSTAFGPGRLVSLDAYRGFVMLLMASDGLGIATYVKNTHAGGIWPVLVHHTNHVEWRGCTLWDLIQPSFTFIVGVALPFSLAKRRSQGHSFGRLLSRAIVRSLLLIGLGIFLRSVGKPQTNFTFEDTLTQIGLGYTFAFLLAWARPRWQVAVVVVLLLGYWLAFALFPVPPAGFDYASVGVISRWHVAHGLKEFAAHWDKNTNLAAAFDRWFLNEFPRAERFVFNRGGYQTLNFIPTLATMILGLLAGDVMRGREPAARKFWLLVIAGLIGLAVGGLLDVTRVCPCVKRIWTPSWALFSTGWACLLLAAFYAAIDWRSLRRWAFPLVVVGMNSIAMYCLADSGFRDFLQASFRTHMNTLLHTHLGELLVSDRARSYGPIVNSAAALLVLWLVCLWMYRRKIFLRI